MTDVPNLYRVVLQVSDLASAAEFYSKLLGISGREIRGGRHYFDCGAIILALLDPTGGGEKAKPNPEHIYFSVQDLEKIHTQASALGCLSKEAVHGAPAGEIVKRPWGERSFYAIDPWENKLCFVDARTLFTGK
jgi:predicted enzyme related to lactoylglutathione lyase